MSNSTKFLIILPVIILISIFLIWLFFYQNPFLFTAFNETEGRRDDVGRMEMLENEGGENTDEDSLTNSSESPETEDISIVAENLSTPWEIAFLPDDRFLVTERVGRLTVFGNGAEKSIPIPDVEHVGEGGLLGLALHPDFSENRYLYLYHTSRVNTGLINRVVRYEFRNDNLEKPQVIIENIPGARFHDGGRITFGPAGFLYVATGDAQTPALAQDINSLAGKILRIRDDGSIPEDNPFSSTGSEQAGAVWSYGHRNPQGLAWDSAGRLWITEHGPSGSWPNCCQDEINLIEKGGNYGWPDSVGDTVLSGTTAPALHSGQGTWAPASSLYWDGSLFFGGLRSETLYEARLDFTPQNPSGQTIQVTQIIELRKHFKGEFGRIRTVTLGPDGMFYLTTSNRDGRGNPKTGDDKVIRVNPQIFR